MNIPLSAIVIQPDQFRPQIITCFYDDEPAIHIRRLSDDTFYSIPTKSASETETCLFLDKNVTIQNMLRCFYYLGVNL